MAHASHSADNFRRKRGWVLTIRRDGHCRHRTRIGAKLGGWITDNYSWRWIYFLYQLPVGLIAYCCGQTDRRIRHISTRNLGAAVRVDYPRFGLLAVGMARCRFCSIRDKEEDGSDELHR